MLSKFDEASRWASEKVAGAAEHLDSKTPCEQWDARALINHMCDSQQYFISKARGEDASMPAEPPDLIGSDPVLTYNSYAIATLEAYRDPDVQEKEAMGLGLTFVDQLVHAWDLAKATGQDTTMPPKLAEAAFELIDGQMPADKRGDMFKAEIATAPNVPAQDKLLAYTGRNP